MLVGLGLARRVRIGFGITHVPATRSREPMGDDLLGGEHFCWNRHGGRLLLDAGAFVGSCRAHLAFATVGVGVLVLAVASRGWITFKIPADFWIRGMQPLLVIAIASSRSRSLNEVERSCSTSLGSSLSHCFPVSMTSVTSSCASD